MRQDRIFTHFVILYRWQYESENIEILLQKGKVINILGFMNTTGNQVKIYSNEGSINADFVILIIIDCSYVRLCAYSRL